MSVRTSLVVASPGEVWVHQDSTRLGGWEAVVVQGTGLLLNLTLHHTCGLVLGRVQGTRWVK